MASTLSVVDLLKCLARRVPSAALRFPQVAGGAAGRRSASVDIARSADVVQRFAVGLSVLVGGRGERQQRLARELGRAAIGMAKQVEQYPQPGQLAGINSGNENRFRHKHTSKYSSARAGFSLFGSRGNRGAPSQKTRPVRRQERRQLRNPQSLWKYWHPPAPTPVHYRSVNEMHNAWAVGLRRATTNRLKRRRSCPLHPALGMTGSAAELRIRHFTDKAAFCRQLPFRGAGAVSE